MNKPAVIPIEIPRGNRFAVTLAVTDGLTGDEIDVHSLGPWRGEVRHYSRATLVATITIETDADTPNLLFLSIEPAETLDLALTQHALHSWDAIDASGEPWFKGPVTVGPSITEHA